MPAKPRSAGRCVRNVVGPDVEIFVDPNQVMIVDDPLFLPRAISNDVLAGINVAWVCALSLMVLWKPAIFAPRKPSLEAEPVLTMRSAMPPLRVGIRGRPMLRLAECSDVSARVHAGCLAKGSREMRGIGKPAGKADRRKARFPLTQHDDRSADLCSPAQ